MLNPGDISEFIGGYHGICGETALAVAIAAAHNTRVQAAEAIAITNFLVTHNLAASNGATPISNLGEYCRQNGIGIATEIDYHTDNSIPFDLWHQILLDHAGSHPIVLELSQGGLLSDIETGGHDEQGLNYHFITVVGKQIDGYICSDPDNSDVPTGGEATRYQIYDIDTLKRANPCGVLMLL